MTSRSAKQAGELNPRTQDYEFLGPPGALAITLGVPFMTFAFSFGCNEDVGCSPRSFISAILSVPSWVEKLWDTQAFLLYSAYYFYLIACWLILPGNVVQGTRIRDGTQKHYKVNGFATFVVTLAATGLYILAYGPGSFTFIYDRFAGFATAGLVWATVTAVWVYARSFRQGALLALGGNSGNVVYDFFIGRELNPTLGSLDLKSFNEVRPGMILWALIDISCLCHQTVVLGRPTASMIIICAFQIVFYIADCVYNEAAILTTMDITTDGFGFMLSVSDFHWVPFVYSLQARFLAFHPVALGPLGVVGALGTAAAGYYIFRVANLEKNDFRNGRNPKNLRFMVTESGSKLLTSGWWGFLRHPNYLGDWIMALSWSLLTGFSTPIPYFYVVYFLILLVHRDSRDDHNCAKKYGKDWDKYKTLVRYTIFPFIY
ncbi:ERG4/ERG24 ergosterol biosynthesis protein [Auriculariales sp. MPI-PUGE-AT-0066]|nr:ERG4/ERG24 ergosterol biosynthesis protein [Auriculariales sp. MPI-PUGE-AT-0066]